MSVTYLDSINISTVYTFAMPKFVYVQTKELQHSVGIQADSAEESGQAGSNDYKLTIKRDGKEVGKFMGSSIVGWWIADK